MTKEGPERILAGLREFSNKDKAITDFLDCIFNKELEGIHFWNKEYNKKVDKYSKMWDGSDED
ncbi:hypothetical protein KTG15_02660 [Methanobacterium sp. YSL]|nr:hypothetical protein [Methanobacterium sp. YSL]